MDVLRCAAFIALIGSLTACGAPAVPPAQQYATISGRAYDVASNAPVSGVTITVDVVLSATTGSDGRYVIKNVPNGPWEYQVTVPTGYARPSLPPPSPLTPNQTLDFPIPLTHL